jgi:hypothetical protein
MIDIDKTYIVLIGIESYQDETLHPLPSAFDNVAALSKVFMKQLGISRNNIKRLLDIEDKDDLLQKLKEIIKNNDIKTLILYYAGHGVLDENMSHYYLTLTNTEVDDLEFTGLTIQKLNERLGSRNWNVILILDSCFSEKAFEEFTQRNFFVMASSAKNKTSKYPLNDDTSAFTGKFLEVMQEGVNNGKEKLSFDDIFSEMKRRLVATGYPEPKKASQNDTGALDFFPNAFVADEKQVGQTDQECLDQLFDALVVHSPRLIELRNNIMSLPTFQQELKKMILEQFPFPVAYFLKNLFPFSADVDALYLSTFYENIIKYVGTLVIADIATRPKESISDELRDTLEMLSAPRHKFYQRLLKQAIRELGETLFISELAQNQSSFWSAFDALESCKKNDEQEIEVWEKHIVTLLASLSFLSKYQMVSVRFIDVMTSYRLNKTEYRHQMSLLHGENPKPYQASLVLSNNHLHSSSVLLFKADAQGAIQSNTPYLNLWPLLIDVNSFEAKNSIPELHFYDSKKDEKYYYRQIIMKKEEVEAKPYRDFHRSLTAGALNELFTEFENNIL